MVPTGRSSDAPARNGVARPAAYGSIGRRRRMPCEPGPLKTRVTLVADLFCGAGGSSTGARRALASLGLQMNLVAVNHWNVAIETHSRNHPEARHYCQNVNTVKPTEVVPEGKLDLLMASPTCTYHSRARGANRSTIKAAWTPGRSFIGAPNCELGGCS